MDKQEYKVNCLTYLLDLWRKGNRFTIFYDGNHCWSESFDLGNCKKKDVYYTLEHFHSKDVVINSFELNLEDSKTLNEYYEFRATKNK